MNVYKRSACVLVSTIILVVCVCMRTDGIGHGKSHDLELSIAMSLLSIRSYNVGLYVCAGLGMGHRQEDQPTAERTLEKLSNVESLPRLSAS